VPDYRQTTGCACSRFARPGELAVTRAGADAVVVVVKEVERWRLWRGESPTWKRHLQLTPLEA